MNPQIQKIITELRRGLEAIYSARLKSLYLFGSYARNEQDVESDLDVLVVLDEIQSYNAEIERTSHLIGELSLRYGVSLSRIFVTDRDWKASENLFLAHVRKEAVAA